MAITIAASGADTLAATGPGTVASKAVTVAGMTSADEVLITISSDAAQDLQRNYAAQYTLQVVKGAGSFTVYANQAQTPAIKFDYLVITGTA